MTEQSSELNNLKTSVDSMLAAMNRLITILTPASASPSVEPKAPKSTPVRPRASKTPKEPKVTSPKPRRGPVSGKGRPNLFESMKDSIPLEKEPGWDKLNDAVPRTARRSPYKPKKMKCEECGAKVEVHPELARDNFTCDRCLTKKVKR